MFLFLMTLLKAHRYDETLDLTNKAISDATKNLSQIIITHEKTIVTTPNSLIV